MRVLLDLILAEPADVEVPRRWVREVELRSTAKVPIIESRPEVAPAAPPAAFVALQLPAPVIKDIRVEVRRGPTTISVTWPAEAAGECAMWIRELLR